MKKSDKQKKDTYINLDKSGQESDSDINSVQSELSDSSSE